MLTKLIVFSLTFLVLVAAGTVILFMMLVAMNGFSESDAMWGLGAYGVLALLITGAMSTGATLLTARFVKREFSPLVACLIAVPLFSLVGIVCEILGSLIGVGVAEIVRRNF